MKQLKYFLLLLLLGCSSTKVIYDYDSKTNFKVFKTFNFFDDAGKGLNELDIKRITNELKNGLQKKGMKLSDTPDVYINIISEQAESVNRNTIGVGIGGGGNVGFGISGGIPIGAKKINQQLTIDFVDSTNDNLLWQGIANSKIKVNIGQEERLVHYKKVITEMLMNYPPNK